MYAQTYSYLEQSCLSLSFCTILNDPLFAQQKSANVLSKNKSAATFL